MTKNEFVDRVAAESGLSKKDAGSAVDAVIRSIETAPFLSESQKRDILYNNAARFLRLSAGEIASDHVD